MRKEHSIDFRKFENLCQRLGHAPKVRSFGVGILKPESDGEFSLQRGMEEGDSSIPIPFVISTPGTKRDGNIVDQAGWHLENYRKNPVVLWAHNQQMPPIGQCPEIGLQSIRDLGGKCLVGSCLFEPDERSQMIRGQYQRGTLNATSVGWLPIAYDIMRDEDGYWTGFHFKEMDMLEYSCVPVPADPQALKRALSAGNIPKEYADLFTLNRLFDKDPENPEDIFWLGLPNRGEIETKTYSISKTDLDVLDKTESEVRVAAPKEIPDGGGESVTVRDAIDYDEHGEVETVDDSYTWSMSKARERLAKHATNENGINWRKYRKGYVYVDPKNRESVDGYMGLHHDVVDDSLVLVPRALKRVAQRLYRGDFDIPEGDKASCMAHLGEEAKRINWTPPWERSIGDLYLSTLRVLSVGPDDVLVEELRAQAVRLGVELFGEDRLNETWEVSDLAGEIARNLSGNVEAREAQAEELLASIQSHYRTYHSAMGLVREIFNLTGIDNSEELLRWIQERTEDEDIVETDSNIDEAADRISKLLESREINVDNDTEIDNNEVMDLGSYMERISQLLPVAGNDGDN